VKAPRRAAVKGDRKRSPERKGKTGSVAFTVAESRIESGMCPYTGSVANSEGRDEQKIRREKKKKTWHPSIMGV